MQENMGGKRPFFGPEKVSGVDVPLWNTPEELLDLIVKSEIEVIELRSKAHYAANLFDLDALVAKKKFCHAKPLESPENQEYLELYARFIEADEACHTIEQGFDLFMSETFHPFLGSLDLGKTSGEPTPAQFDDLVEQYRALRTRLLDDGTVEAELSRETSGREIHFRPDALVAEDENGAQVLTPNWALGVRNRPLLRFETDDGEIITITKRMTFIVPAELALHLAPHAKGDVRSIQDAVSMAEMESMLDENDPLITPVRTLYYVTKAKKKPGTDQTKSQPISE